MNLWRVASISSSPLVDLDGEPGMYAVICDPHSNAPRPSCTCLPCGARWIGWPRNTLWFFRGCLRKTETMDTKIKAYDGHEAPVYAVAWSASDAWVFASVSHDGRVVVSLVPSTEKYKILL